jgi:hypothetical protein
MEDVADSWGLQQCIAAECVRQLPKTSLIQYRTSLTDNKDRVGLFELTTLAMPATFYLGAVRK